DSGRRSSGACAVRYSVCQAVISMLIRWSPAFRGRAEEVARPCAAPDGTEPRSSTLVEVKLARRANPGYRFCRRLESNRCTIAVVAGECPVVGPVLWTGDAGAVDGHDRGQRPPSETTEGRPPCHRPAPPRPATGTAARPTWPSRPPAWPRPSGAPAPSTASTCGSRPGACTASWGPTARARPPSSACSPPCCAPTADGPGCSATTWCARPTPCAPG